MSASGHLTVASWLELNQEAVYPFEIRPSRWRLMGYVLLHLVTLLAYWSWLNGVLEQVGAALCLGGHCCWLCWLEWGAGQQARLCLREHITLELLMVPHEQGGVVDAPANRHYQAFHINPSSMISDWCLFVKLEAPLRELKGRPAKRAGWLTVVMPFAFSRTRWLLIMRDAVDEVSYRRLARAVNLSGQKGSAG